MGCSFVGGCSLAVVEGQGQEQVQQQGGYSLAVVLVGYSLVVAEGQEQGLQQGDCSSAVGQVGCSLVVAEEPVLGDCSSAVVQGGHSLVGKKERGQQVQGDCS